MVLARALRGVPRGANGADFGDGEGRFVRPGATRTNFDHATPLFPIIADLRQTVAWADERRQRWAFTTSNATSCTKFWRDLKDLGEINWEAVQAKQWQECKEDKQAEFLIERRFPWSLILRIGVRSKQMRSHVVDVVKAARRKPRVEIKPNWYY